MYIKGFDKDLCCRGMQFEVGKTYDTGANPPLKICSSDVFHFCESINAVHEYYRVDIDNRFCEIEVLGDIVQEDNKIGSNKIRIVREIIGQELDVLIGRANGNSGTFNTGNYNKGNYNTGNRNKGNYNTGNRNTGDCNTGHYNTGDWNTGNYNTGNGNTGDRNTGDWNTGDRNTGDCNTGNCNTGDCNTGDYNTGNYNTGDCNTGDCNTGDCNTGNYNTGNYNTGDYNTGNWNSCNYSSGFFCTTEPKIHLFNKATSMTVSEFLNSKYYTALNSSSFNLVYIENEKVKERAYKEACALWWENMSDENKEIIKSIPNFDAEIFKEITGIEV